MKKTLRKTPIRRALMEELEPRLLFSADPLTYTIVSGNAAGAFSIDAATGQIRVANPTLLDFETGPSFTLQVQVTDSGAPGLSDTAFVTIQLNDLAEVAVTPPGPIPPPEPTPEPEPVAEPKPTVVAMDINPEADQTTPFHQALNVMSEGVGTTDILEEVQHNDAGGIQRLELRALGRFPDLSVAWRIAARACSGITAGLAGFRPTADTGGQETRQESQGRR